MSEIDLETRKKIVLDRLATELAQQELADEKAVREAEARRIAQEALQKVLFSEMESILPALCEINWKAFPAFLGRVDETLSELSAEFDELVLQETSLKNHFRDLRSRYKDAEKVIGLVNAQSQKMPKNIEYSAELARVLDMSFRDQNGDITRLLGNTILRFLDFRRRAIQGIAEMIGG